MSMYHKCTVGDKTISPIDWEMTPELTFGTFESWGGRERVRNNDERIYYFFVDNWGDEPKLCLMERGVKHARIIAEIKAPQELIKECVDNQGEVAFYDRSFAIDEHIRTWLIDNVLDSGNEELIVPVIESVEIEDMGERLPVWDGVARLGDGVTLPSVPRKMSDSDVETITKEWDFFDARINPTGFFANHLHDSGNTTIVDQRTGLMWQRGGLDITSIRTMNKQIVDLNSEGFAGFYDWRLPTMEEALSLLEPVMNFKGIYLNSNFSKEQPFIFVAGQRDTGGYWFVDFKQGCSFWSSGTIPGAFGRLCRAAG